jgi:hypothetical protein
MTLLISLSSIYIVLLWISSNMPFSLTDAKDVAAITQSFLVGSGSIVAILAINKWRNEVVYKRKVELAEEVSDLFSRAVFVFQDIRNPFSSAAEGTSRPQGEHESPEQTDRLNHLYVTLERIQRHFEFFQKIETYRNKFLLYFGDEFESAFEAVDSIRRNIRATAVTRYQVGLQGGSWDDEDWRHIIWETKNNDEINQKLLNAKEQIWQVCKAVIQKSLE